MSNKRDYLYDYPHKVCVRVNELGLDSDKKLILAHGQKLRVSSEDFNVIKDIVRTTDRTHTLEIHGRRVYE